MPLGLIATLALCATLLLFLRGCRTRHSRSVVHGDLTFDVTRDGRRIVFTGEGRGLRDIYLFDRQDRSIRNLTQSLDYEVAPSFSPDGTQIVITRGIAGVRADQLCTLNLFTGKITQWTSADENVSNPSFTPDGKSILYSLETEYRWGGLASNWREQGPFKIIDLASKKVTLFQGSQESASEPAFSHDGQQFAFVTRDASTPLGSIWTANADGSGAAMLTDGGGSLKMGEIVGTPVSLSAVVDFRAKGMYRLEDGTDVGVLVPGVGESAFKAAIVKPSTMVARITQDGDQLIIGFGAICAGEAPRCGVVEGR